MEEQKAEEDNRFLKGRKIANTISETGEALLDLDDLLRVQLNDDNVQGFDRHQVRRRYIVKLVQEASPFLGGVETSHDFVSAGYSPQRRNCNQWISKGQCSRGDSCSFKHDVNAKGAVRNEKTLERRRKRRYQRERHSRYQSARKVTYSSLHSFPGGCNAKRNPHAIIGTHLNAHITHRRVDTNGGTCVYSSTEAKLVKKHMVWEQFPYNRKKHRNSIVF